MKQLNVGSIGALAAALGIMLNVVACQPGETSQPAPEAPGVETPAATPAAEAPASMPVEEAPASPAPQAIRPVASPSPTATNRPELMTSDRLTTDELKQYAGEPGVALLKWSTESEENNFGFAVMRAASADGPFVQINEKIILGAGNSSTRNDYSYYDMQVKVGETFFYRIDTISFSGEVHPYITVLKWTVNRRWLGGEPPVNSNAATTGTMTAQ
jgi:hypothetical protein